MTELEMRTEQFKIMKAQWRNHLYAMQKDHGFDMSDFSEKSLAHGNVEQPPLAGHATEMIGWGASLFLGWLLVLVVVGEFVENRRVQVIVMPFAALASLTGWTLGCFGMLVMIWAALSQN